MGKIYGYDKLEDCCEILDLKEFQLQVVIEKSGDYPYYGANGIQDYVEILFSMMNLYCCLKMVANFGSKDDQLHIEFQENVG